MRWTLPTLGNDCRHAHHAFLFEPSHGYFLVLIMELASILGFLVVQLLRIHVPMLGTQVRSLVWEDPTCCRAANLCATTTEPTL